MAADGDSVRQTSGLDELDHVVISGASFFFFLLPEHDGAFDDLIAELLKERREVSSQDQVGGHIGVASVMVLKKRLAEAIVDVVCDFVVAASERLGGRHRNRNGERGLLQDFFSCVLPVSRRRKLMLIQISSKTSQEVLSVGQCDLLGQMVLIVEEWRNSLSVGGDEEIWICINFCFDLVNRIFDLIGRRLRADSVVDVPPVDVFSSFVPMRTISWDVPDDLSEELHMVPEVVLGVVFHRYVVDPGEFAFFSSEFAAQRVVHHLGFDVVLHLLQPEISVESHQIDAVVSRRNCCFDRFEFGADGQSRREIQLLDERIRRP